MGPETLQPGASGAESSRMTAASTNASLGETQQQRGNQLVHHDAAIVDTEYMTQDAQLKTVRTTGSGKNKKQPTIECESIHIHVDDGQQTIWHTVGHRELRDQFIAGSNGKPPWSTKAFVHTVRKIEHHDFVSSAIFADEFCDKHPREWANQTLKTLEEATEFYMVEIIGKSHFRRRN